MQVRVVLRGVVDEHVDAAELLPRRSRDGQRGLAFADVGRQVQGALAAGDSGSLRETASTRPPSSVRSRTVASPMPAVPPVTITRLPSSRMQGSFHA